MHHLLDTFTLPEIVAITAGFIGIALVGLSCRPN